MPALTEGLIWLDNNPRVSFQDKLLDGIAAYERRFKRKPTHCVVNPSDLPKEEGRVAGLTISGAPTVLRHHFFIGVRR